MNLSDVKIIVTGAASGMGRAFSLMLARDGAAVMACDIDEAGLASLKEEAEGTLETCVADVTDEASVANLVETTVDALGGVNGVVNNAGIFRDALLVKKDRKTGDIRKMTMDEWQSVIDVDLTGPFLCTREVAAHIIESGGEGGVIVNISSVSRHGNRGQSNYSAAKAGLIADTKLWAEELSRHGIRVGAVAPGFIDTPILQGMPERMLEKMTAQIPLGRVGKPEEIYQAVKFVIECDYFTGRCIDVDGGVQV
ncbi:SDR family oxidoreductase [Persicimonas caeni]|uniref:SDR family oxidoreductase n=1 Tax=Persicimonas caeni TaxID=2292766 RepID=A0A4Y6PPK1_PERCE|nr:SDR family oxidoreductase [Persicimonas caeni]QDG50281.1 SDR family oxidoreductase [Persicimonas caeni]QED31502.1 SDR family oxidoreductase [Persicimonas caeni]